MGCQHRADAHGTALKWRCACLRARGDVRAVFTRCAWRGSCRAPAARGSACGSVGVPVGAWEGARRAIIFGVLKELSVVLVLNLDNLNLDMCMELLEQTPRGQRAAQLGPGGRQDGSRPLRHEHRARQRLGRLCRGARSNSAPPRSPSLSTYTPRSRPPVGSPKADFPELRSAPLVECRRPQLCFVPLQSIEAHLSTISAPPSRRPERCRCRAR